MEFSVIGRLPRLAIMLSVSGVFGGCSAPESSKSAEWVRDPLGIDRAVDNYYFPDAGRSAGNVGVDATVAPARQKAIVDLSRS